MFSAKKSQTAVNPARQREVNMQRFILLILLSIVCLSITANPLTANPIYPSIPLGVAGNPLASPRTETPLISNIIHQTWGGAWNDEDRYELSYNEHDLCTSITHFTWSFDINGWDAIWRNDYSYDESGNLLSYTIQVKQDGVWGIGSECELIYDYDRLVQIVATQYMNGEPIPSVYYDFLYSGVSGRMTLRVETFWPFSDTNPPMNKFVYEWDDQGRPILMQKYQKHLLDQEWEINVRSTYSYEAFDESTYADHIKAILLNYTSLNMELISGFKPFKLQYSSDSYTEDLGVNWSSMSQTEYTYNTLEQITDKKYYSTILGTHILMNQTCFEYYHGMQSSAIYYEPSEETHELMPLDRYLFEYIWPSSNEDGNAPALNGTLSASPNPFTQRTCISFDLAKAGMVQLDVYNLKGQKVKSIANAYFNTGKHEVYWDATDNNGKQAASGVYLLRLSSDKQSQTIKTVLLRN